MGDRYKDIPVIDEKIYQRLKSNLSLSNGDMLPFEEYISLMQKAFQKALLALEEEDDQKFASLCHNIKSITASLGYMRLSAICDEIDVCYKNNERVYSDLKKNFLFFYTECVT